MRLAVWVRGLVAAILTTSGCGGGGGDTTNQATVPTPVVALSDAQAVETGAGASLTIIAALRALAGDAPAASTVAAAMTGGGAGQASQCLNGGVLLARCSAQAGKATITTRAEECELLDAASGYRVTFNGELRVAIAAPDVCRSGALPDGVPRTYRYRFFQAVVRDGTHVVETFDAPQLTERVTPRGGGCAARQSDSTLSGRVQIRRDDGTDVRVDTNGLRLARRFDGTPCTARLVADGVATFTDVAGARAVRAALHDVVLSGAYRLIGDADLACAGAFGFDVETDDTATCPSGAGALRLPSGADAAVGFDAGAVRLDADGDGTAERALDSCLALAPTGCS
jgi:hypothetical protein